MVICPKCDTPMLRKNHGYECGVCGFEINRNLENEHEPSVVYLDDDEYGNEPLGIGAIYPAATTGED